MELKNIEVEFRAPIGIKKFFVILKKLKNYGKLKKTNKRLSVMFFPIIHNTKYDIRVRTKERGAELVIKKGSYNSHRRIEISQDISKKQFIGVVRALSLFGFQTKVGERVNYIFSMPGGIEATLVEARNLAYLEIEKLASKEKISSAKKEILKWYDRFGIKPIRSEKIFLHFCRLLSKKVDWNFHGRERDFDKLKKLLRKY